MAGPRSLEPWKSLAHHGRTNKTETGERGFGRPFRLVSLSKDTSGRGQSLLSTLLHFIWGIFLRPWRQQEKDIRSSSYVHVKIKRIKRLRRAALIQIPSSGSSLKFGLLSAASKWYQQEIMKLSLKIAFSIVTKRIDRLNPSYYHLSSGWSATSRNPSSCHTYEAFLLINAAIWDLKRGLTATSWWWSIVSQRDKNDLCSGGNEKMCIRRARDSRDIATKRFHFTCLQNLHVTSHIYIQFRSGEQTTDPKGLEVFSFVGQSRYSWTYQ
jgi:hypothetical protein